MRKSDLSYGMKVRCKKTGLEVTVVDLASRPDWWGNETVGISVDGSLAKYVNTGDIEPIVEPVQGPVGPQGPAGKSCYEVCENKSSTLLKLKVRYEEETESAFLVVNDKLTICIPGISYESFLAIGTSSKNDGDEFNDEIGDALAFHRGVRNQSILIERILNEKDFSKMLNEVASFTEEDK